MLIPWLLKGDGYPPGVVVALLLHGFLLYIFMPKDFEPADRVTIQPMSYVVASMATQSPQKLRRLEQQNTQQRNAENARERQREADRQRQREQAQAAEAEVARQREAERQRLADEQKLERQREEERQRLADEQERERQREAQRVADERERAEQEAARVSSLLNANNNAQQQSVEDQLVSQYLGIIHDLISGAWRLPPAARNGMLAIVQLRLTPTGDIITRQIVQSSGTPEFDRSVLEAVDRVGSFPELKDMPSAVFERQFRAGINLEFSPEDLLR